ncbi:MAG: hypothetical protein AB8G16_14040 [Gammaproteobacteria bacterium]
MKATKTLNQKIAAVFLCTMLAGPAAANYTMTMGNHDSPPPQPERVEIPEEANSAEALETTVFESLRRLLLGSQSD